MSTRSISRWWLLLVGLVAAALCIPFMRTVWLGDEGTLLHGADNILQHRRLYVDFFEFLPPGGFVLTAAWFSVAGISVFSARLLAVLTIVGIACFTYLACRQASRNAPFAALLATGWVAMSQGVWTQVSHHWFTTLFSMVAAWAVLAGVEQPRRRLRWPLIAGMAAGATAMVTPTRGALTMLAAVTAFLDPRRQRARLIAYLLASALAPAGLLAYVVAQQAFTAAFDDVIRWTAERYASIQGVPFGAFADAQNFPLKYLFPVTALLLVAICLQDWRGCVGDRLLRPCVAFGVAGFVGCFPRPDIVHIAFTAPLACPLLAHSAIRLGQSWRPSYRRAAVAVAIGLYGTALLSIASKSQTALRGQIIATPRGDVTFLDEPRLPELLARIAATPKDAAFFFYPYMPMLPFLTAREQTSKYDIFVPGYTSPAQYQDACQSVMSRASWVVIDRSWTEPELLKRIFPAIQDTRPPETRRFEQALDSGFQLEAQAGTFELRRRRDGASAANCAATTE